MAGVVLGADGGEGADSSRAGLTFTGPGVLGKDGAGAPRASPIEADALVGDPAGSIEGLGGTKGALFFCEL